MKGHSYNLVYIYQGKGTQPQNASFTLAQTDLALTQGRDMDEFVKTKKLIQANHGTCFSPGLISVQTKEKQSKIWLI